MSAINFRDNAFNDVVMDSSDTFPIVLYRARRHGGLVAMVVAVYRIVHGILVWATVFRLFYHCSRRCEWSSEDIERLALPYYVFGGLSTGRWKNWC